MSNQITITEALGELKTITKRLQKKRAFVRLYLTHDSKMKDPLEKSGGSKTALSKELQSIGDLELRIVAIRSAINKCNQETDLTIGEQTQTVSSWLIWRREVKPAHEQFLALMINAVQGGRQDSLYARQSSSVVQDGSDVVVNIDEGQLNKDIEQLETVLGTLDSQLSLINATTVLDLD